MNEYKKLQLAHKIADGFKFRYWSIDYCYGNPDKFYLLQFKDSSGMVIGERYKDIDSLINRLLELSAYEGEIKGFNHSKSNSSLREFLDWLEENKKFIPPCALGMTLQELKHIWDELKEEET